MIKVKGLISYKLKYTECSQWNIISIPLLAFLTPEFFLFLLKYVRLLELDH